MGDDGICSRQEEVQSQPSHLPISSLCSCLVLTLWSSNKTGGLFVVLSDSEDQMYGNNTKRQELELKG